MSDEHGAYVYHYDRHGALLHVIRPTPSSRCAPMPPDTWSRISPLVLVYRVTLPTYVPPDTDRRELADHDDHDDHRGDHDHR
ncbi:MAG: hypothetical protein JOY90_35150 [Bradyrhizobium sp.]|uniref:hypothetical protein n=1 Tax=Bradyrhizobium sp. TaxID=376 RepID=UPI001D5F4164|nr:hypothetical protein [Bradyrhizobium sp.]MBV9565653.1 hypothetical protein [Bradyrhizobium sp.]